MPPPGDWPDAPGGVPIRRWCRAKTSAGHDQPQRLLAQTRRFERHVLAFRMRQQVANARSLTYKTPVGVVAHQNISWSTPIGDDDGPLICRALGAPDILVEFATRQSSHLRHAVSCSYRMILSDST